MSKPLVVEGDPVDGTDTHEVEGVDTTAPNPAPYSGTGRYTYKGEVSTGLSPVVVIDGKPLALVTSGSTLRPDGTTAHDAKLGGSDFMPKTPAPATATLEFDPLTGVGDGKPDADAGSAVLTVNKVKVLLDGDPFDTCGIDGGRKSSTVEAKGQGFVSCSE